MRNKYHLIIITGSTTGIYTEEVEADGLRVQDGNYLFYKNIEGRRVTVKPLSYYPKNRTIIKRIEKLKG